MDWECLSDIDLMTKVQQGHLCAFDAIVHKHQHSLFNFFRKIGVSSLEAEDLTQEVFLRLFSYRKEYKPLAKFTTFLYTLAHHVWVDYLRKNKSRISATSLPEMDTLQEAIFFSYSDKSDLQEALNTLPEHLRSIVVMSIYQRLKYQEIADILKIPLGTVKSRMFCALRQIKEICNAKEFQS